MKKTDLLKQTKMIYGIGGITIGLVLGRVTCKGYTEGEVKSILEEQLTEAEKVTINLKKQNIDLQESLNETLNDFEKYMENAEKLELRAKDVMDNQDESIKRLEGELEEIKDYLRKDIEKKQEIK